MSKCENNNNRYYIQAAVNGGIHTSDRSEPNRLYFPLQGRQTPGLDDLHGLYIMLPGEGRMIFMIWRRFPAGLDLYHTDAAQHIKAIDTRYI